MFIVQLSLHVITENVKVAHIILAHVNSVSVLYCIVVNQLVIQRYPKYEFV